MPASKVIILNYEKSTTFVVKEIVPVNIPGVGSGYGAKEDGCSDYTKIMIVELDGPKEEEALGLLKAALKEALSKIP